MEQPSAVYLIPILYDMYEAAISDEDNCFWYINLLAKKKKACSIFDLITR